MLVGKITLIHPSDNSRLSVEHSERKGACLPYASHVIYHHIDAPDCRCHGRYGDDQETVFLEFIDRVKDYVKQGYKLEVSA